MCTGLSSTICGKKVLHSAEKVLHKLPLAAAIFNPNCLYTSDREQIPPG